MIDDAQKLAAVERLIEDFVWAKHEPQTREHATYWALKALAADLHAKAPGAGPHALRELERRIAAVEKARALGYAGGAMIGVGEELIGRWAVVRMALERLGEP